MGARGGDVKLMSAQIMFTLNGGGPWMCRVPESEWPGGGDSEVIEAIKLDFMGEWGDREFNKMACQGVWYEADVVRTGRQERECQARRGRHFREDVLTYGIVVFIGQDLDKALMDKTLKEAELTDKEWAQWEKVGRFQYSRLAESQADNDLGDEIEEERGEEGTKALRPV